LFQRQGAEGEIPGGFFGGVIYLGMLNLELRMRSSGNLLEVTCPFMMTKTTDLPCF